MEDWIRFYGRRLGRFPLVLTWKKIEDLRQVDGKIGIDY